MDPEKKASRRVLPKKALIIGNLILASGAILSACGGDNGDNVVNPNPEPTIPPLSGKIVAPEVPLKPTVEIDTQSNKFNPIWSQDQLAMNQNELPVEKLIFTQHLTPPFYDGPEPLTFTRFREKQFSISSIEIIYADEFENFSNFYVYDGIFLIGAQTYNDQGLIAEARLEYFPEGEMLKPDEVILHEVHYDSSGNVIFTSKSEIDFITSLKIKELESEGQKDDEYYFLLPLQ